MELVKVADYLRNQGIEVDSVEVLPSFIDAKNEIIGQKIEWSSLAKQTHESQNLSQNSAESMSLASMAAIHMLELEPGMKLLDTCAAPGMKTLYSLLLQPDIEVTAIDLSRERLSRLKRLLAKHGKHAQTLNHDARFLHKTLPAESFDRILIDAPCSGEGLIFAGDEKQLNAWSSAKVKRLQQIQLHIIKSAWQLLKPGGRLVYSTCTLNRNENERVIQKALKTTLEIQEFSIQTSSLPVLESGQALRILPSINSIGFFIATVSKTLEAAEQAITDYQPS